LSIRGTFNINSSCYCNEDDENIRNTGRLKLSEAKELYISSGNEVAIHTYTHANLSLLRNEEIVREILFDKNNIETEYKTIARGMAYPFGAYNENVLDVLKNIGIAYSRTVSSTNNFTLPKNWLTMNPTCHHNNPNLNDLAKKIVDEAPKWNTVWMFLLWGHSFEFARDDSWDKFEEFSEIVSGKKRYMVCN